MAAEFEIEDFLQKLKDIYGDKFNTKPATIAIWLKGLKFATSEHLENALQAWIESNQRVPTLTDIRALAKRYQPAKAEPMTAKEWEAFHGIEQQNLKDGLRKVKTHDGAYTWMRQEYCCRYKNEIRNKIDVIIEYFGHEDWITTLRTELGIAKEKGLKGINAFITNLTTVKKYRELVDRHVFMIQGVEAA